MISYDVGSCKLYVVLTKLFVLHLIMIPPLVSVRHVIVNVGGDRPGQSFVVLNYHCSRLSVLHGLSQIVSTHMVCHELLLLYLLVGVSGASSLTGA